VRLHFGSMKHNGFYVNKIDDNEIIIEKHNHETNHNKNNTRTILKKTNKKVATENQVIRSSRIKASIFQEKKLKIKSLFETITISLFHLTLISLNTSV